jgi:hypothetical protein
LHDYVLGKGKREVGEGKGRVVESTEKRSAR